MLHGRRVSSVSDADGAVCATREGRKRVPRNTRRQTRAGPRRRLCSVDLDKRHVAKIVEGLKPWRPCACFFLCGRWLRRTLSDSLQQRLVELRRILDLRRMPELGKLDEGRVRKSPGSLAAEARIVPELLLQLRRGGVLADRGVVLLPDHQQHRILYPTELVEHRLAVDHVVEQRRIPGDELLARPSIHPDEHLHPAVVLCPPLLCVVCRLLVLSDALRGRLHLARVPGVHAAPRDAEALPVLQTDRIDEHHLLDFPRIEQRVARRQHPCNSTTVPPLGRCGRTASRRPTGFGQASEHTNSSGPLAEDSPRDMAAECGCSFST